MTREHPTPISIIRRLRPSPDRFAAAAALQDPSLLLALQAARSRHERPTLPPRSSPRRPDALASIRAALRGETGGALLLVAAVVLALLWSNSPWHASYAAFWHAPVALTVGPWTLADPTAIIIAAVLLTMLLSIRAIAARQFRARGDSTAVLTPLSVLIGLALWLALLQSGIDPVVSGLLIGLLTNGYEPRPQGPAAISPNDRLQRRLHPWTSKVVVPIFALANAGLHVDRHLLASAATSPVTWGIVLAYVIGKPLGIVIASCAASRGMSRRATLSLSWPELRGTALSAGIGFTVSLLIASRAFHGALLDQAKVGILATALVAPALAVVALAPLRRRDAATAARRGPRPVVASLCPAR